MLELSHSKAGCPLSLLTRCQDLSQLELLAASSGVPWLPSIPPSQRGQPKGSLCSPVTLPLCLSQIQGIAEKLAIDG